MSRDTATGLRPKQHARIGTFYLEEAILDVLLESWQTDKCMTPSKIARRAGIFRGRSELAPHFTHDDLVRGFLSKLALEGRITGTSKMPRSPICWMLTRSEYEARREEGVNSG